jgi:hypothetical protein
MAGVANPGRLITHAGRLMNQGFVNFVPLGWMLEAGGWILDAGSGIVDG